MVSHATENYVLTNVYNGLSQEGTPASFSKVNATMGINSRGMIIEMQFRHTE